MIKIYTEGNYFYIQEIGIDEYPKPHRKSRILVYKISPTEYRIISGERIIYDDLDFSDIQDEEGNAYASQEAFETFYETNSGNSSGGGNGSGVASVTGSLVDNTDANNPVINTPSANDVFTVNPVITNTNPTQQSVNEQAWTMQRLGNIGDATNPRFHLGRIINGGINEPKWRIMFQDDVLYTSEVACFEVEPSGTLASLRQVIGSHYEGFIGTEVEPMFRIASTDLGSGNRGSRIELGAGGSDATDVFLEKTGANEFRIVLGGGTKQIFYADAVVTTTGIKHVWYNSDTPTQADVNSIKLYSKNGLLHHMDSSGNETNLVLSSRVVVNQTNAISILGGVIDSTKEYFLDGIIDMGTTSINVPSTGITVKGYSFDISGLISSENDYTLFTGSTAGNMILTDIKIEVTGTNSKVYDITDATNTKAIEINSLNYNNCNSLGEITGYRQILESGTGRFGGTPELTLSGVMNGVRISTSIVRGISNITSLFKTGNSLTFSGRFITDINVDLPSNGALIDFSESNITNDESLILEGCFVTRQGVINSSDTTVYPNIDNTSNKSLWSDNTGLPNTTKYIKGTTTTEVTTTVSAINTYYPLEGTITIEQSSHFDMPSNGEYRLLSGNGTYQVSGDFVLESTQNSEVDIRITKSTDNGVTFPTEVNHIKRTINSLSGGRDVGFFPINFIVTLSENDRLRVEVENKSNTSNITAELDSYLVISQV